MSEDKAAQKGNTGLLSPEISRSGNPGRHFPVGIPHELF